MSHRAEPVSEPVLRLAARGDRTAQGQVLSSIYEFVRRTIFRLLLGRRLELDDLTQTALLRVIVALPKYRFESAFKTWVTGICINVVRDHLRKRRRQGVEVASSDTLGDAPLAGSGSLQHQLEAREILSDCATIIDSMSVDQRMAFVLRIVEGHSVDEVAELMGAAKSTTRMRLYYARKAFKKALRRRAITQAPWELDAASGEAGGQ